jgi:hypothetical protein
MRPVFACIIIACLAGGRVFSEETGDKGVAGDTGFQKPRHEFSLLPKAFQKNPELEMTAFTVVTDYGRTFPPASLKAPVYYEAQDSGEQSRGFSIGGDKAPPREVLNDVLQRSLGAAGYLPAKKIHVPGLVLIYFWGSHTRVDSEMAGQFPELARQYVLERAALIGGKVYAHKLEEVLDSGPFNTDRSLKSEFLRDQALDDLYYLVVSAYTYDDVVHNRRRLAWRTTLTVNSRGISMSQGMPALIVMGETFFGHETSEPMTLRRDVRSGTIKLGPLNILESGVPASTTLRTN